MTPKPGANGPSGAAGHANDQGGMSHPHDAAMVFLVGLPGSGKSALGRRVCAELGLRFVDLVDDGSTDATLQELVGARGADVVALPWAPARDARWLDLCRRSGETVALWAHPLDMQARSARAEALFTPVKRPSTRGGFGRSGTGCSEYRHLDRACAHVLLLVDLSEDVAAEELKELIGDLRTQGELSPAEREGLLGWWENWRDDFDADARACEILVDAMARFTMHLKARGTSPRTMSGIYGDRPRAGRSTRERRTGVANRGSTGRAGRSMEACISGLDPPFAGAARLASSRRLRSPGPERRPSSSMAPPEGGAVGSAPAGTIRSSPV